MLSPLPSEDRVRKNAEKLSKAVGQKQQGRLDNFFTVMPKRKADDEGSSSKAAKTAKKGGKAAAPAKGKASASKKKK